MNISFSKPINYFLIFLTLHAVLLVASDVAGKKMIALPFGLSASVAVFSYMATFIIIDVVTEVFGKEAAKKIIRLSFGALLFSVGLLQVAIFLPGASFWNLQAEYQTILGGVWRIALGGWGAYLISQHLDIWIYQKLKQIKFAGDRVSLRAFFSTAVAQLIDTVFFMVVAFIGVFPLLSAIIGQYSIKLLMTLVGGYVVSIISTKMKVHLEK
jgi:uncharacterized integral membrane protein (TIGR00697 family)